MKIVQIFAHFTDEQFKILSEKYNNEQLLKIFLGGKIAEELEKEVESIKTDKALQALSEEIKL